MLINMVIISILVFFLILEEKFSVKYDVSSGLVIYELYYVEGIVNVSNAKTGPEFIHP